MARAKAGSIAQSGVPGTQVGNTYPQTTRGQGQTFAELSRISQRTSYQVGLGTPGWGQTVDQPLAAAPGYLRYLDITVLGASGAGSGTQTLSTLPPGVDIGVHASAILNNVLFRDAAGNTIYSLTDPIALYAINMYSGQGGVLQAADPALWPSYSSISVASGTAGNFMFHIRLPFEIAPGGLGTIAVGAANLQPSLHLGIVPSAAFTTTAALQTTLPAITVEVDANYWAAVPGMAPPDLGTTLQWQQLTANPSVVTGSSSKITLGKSEGYITTLILLFRDSTGQRTDYMLPGGIQSSTTKPWTQPGGIGNRLQLWVDSVLVLDEDIHEVMDRMYCSFPGLAITSNRLPIVGSIVYTFRNSITQAVLGVDDGALWMPVTPGSLLEIGGVGWGSFTNSPGNITALIGSIVPGPGGVQQGLANIAP